MAKDKVIVEDFTDSSSAPPPGGPGGMLPDPVETGDSHALRAPDNLQGDQGVANAQGQDIPRSAMLAVLIQQLMGMDNADLAGCLAEIGDFKTDDATQPGVAAGPVGQDQARNLASVSTKEDVEELFAGEDLSEEYRQKATLIFEAAVQARLSAKMVELEEQAEQDLTEAVETLTEEMAAQIDKYLTYAAEQFVAEHQEQLATVTRNTLAEQFVANLITMTEQFKVESDPTVSVKVAELETQNATIQAKLDEAVDGNIGLTNQIKEYEAKSAFDEVAMSLSQIQRVRFSQLAESIDCDVIEAYKTRLVMIKESILKSVTPKVNSKVLTESVPDGVPTIRDEEGPKASTSAPDVLAVMSTLRRL